MTRAPTAFVFLWTDEALGILTALREIFTTKIEKALRAGADSHARMGELAVAIIDRLVTERPPGLLLDNALAASVLLYLDAVVGELREKGLHYASEVMRRAGWRTNRPGGRVVSPDARRSPTHVVQSPSRTGNAPPVESPERRHVHAPPMETQRPSWKRAGPFYTPT